MCTSRGHWLRAPVLAGSGVSDERQAGNFAGLRMSSVPEIRACRQPANACLCCRLCLHGAAMTRRRRILVSLLGLLIALTLAAGWFGWSQWQLLKQRNGIEHLDWRGLSLSLSGLRLDALDIRQRGENGALIEARLQGMELRMDHWRSPLPIRSLTVSELSLAWQPGSEAEPADDDPLMLPDREQLRSIAAWLPERGRVDRLTVTLPCAERQPCSETGTLQWHRQETQLVADLGLQRDAHRVALAAQMSEQPDGYALDLQLALDEQPRLTATNRLARLDDDLRWTGTLAMSELPEAAWLLSWLERWTASAAIELPATPGEMRLGAGWALHARSQGELPTEPSAWSGDLSLAATLPAAWPIVGVGQVQGRLELAASGTDGQWAPTSLSADLTLAPEASLLEALPPELRSNRLRLTAEPLPDEQAEDRLPVAIRLVAEGPLAGELDARLRFSARAPYRTDISQGRLRLKAKALALPPATLTGLTADLRLSGQASSEQLALTLGKTSTLAAQRVHLAADSPVSLSGVLADLSGLAIQARFPTEGTLHAQAKGPAHLQAKELQQAQLRPQGWRWQATLDADQTRLLLDGPLSNDSGLALVTSLRNPWNGPLTLNARLQDLFFRASNPLASTFSDWPALLELNSGRLQGDLSLTVPPDAAPLQANARITAGGLAGIYDRTELTGLDARLELALAANRLRVDVAPLQLEQANPGIAFGPLQAQGRYEASLDNPTAGTLSWQQAQGRVLGGTVSLSPGRLDLAAPQQKVDVAIEGLQLSQLFIAYPAEGLQGSGLVDGGFEVHRSGEGLRIEGGKLAAREPGGVLQFRSPQIQALGRSNPAMGLVTEALDDFHYSVLDSDVRYDERGKLQLGLRLQGRNPALEGGRPINFSINLEEDIPALLTSLQLSDRVSETIQQRVQERLQRGNAPTTTP
ncbi:dicarboxylate transport [Stutzerimonas nosocomialis]|uniref:Dicarboxylate transport n=2 Tax=Stutzerimonas nosocomialis TaxID=1056496 RepID=A0A5R9QG78_9GAMM|nr:dicarboxylate transport [Stutzerimonas nosocomialis]